MKYSPELYARAFMETVAQASQVKQKALLSRFLEIIVKNGDYLGIKKILSKIEEAVVREKGGRMITLEFAREVEKELAERLKSSFSDNDHILTLLNPELVAGVRVLVDGESELDMSLQRKLKKLFT
ncbi:MAG: hypothetical protein G01um101430_522 [Parcubacteria group bacterium Gr01-1014_30]|nr:MAG: hypothetical protein G01um101430_522 [Parcubacteria group bacterium Gr01-1014_30]